MKKTIIAISALGLLQTHAATVTDSFSQTYNFTNTGSYSGSVDTDPNSITYNFNVINSYTLTGSYSEITFDLLVRPNNSSGVITNNGNTIGNTSPATGLGVSSDAGSSNYLENGENMLIAIGNLEINVTDSNYTYTSDTITRLLNSVTIVDANGGDFDFTANGGGSLTYSTTAGANPWDSRAVVDHMTSNFTAITSVESGAELAINRLNFTVDGDVTLTQVPEPSASALLGLSGLALIIRRKR